MLLGSMEAGGTKMVLCIGDEEQHIFERETISTTSPEETMEKILAFFQGKGIRALGIGSFGPLDLNRRSSTYGYITTTPKTLWRNFPLLPQLRSALRVPVEIDTDVNAAALSEYALGAAQGFNSCLYVTVGTGIGGRPHCGRQSRAWPCASGVWPHVAARFGGRSHAGRRVPLP